MITESMSKELENYYTKKCLEGFYHNAFETDELIEEVVPKYYFRLPIPYFHWEEDDQEFRVGLNWYTLFTLGKEKIRRKAMIWEAKKNTGSLIKFSRYSNVKKTNRKKNRKS